MSLEMKSRVKPLDNCKPIAREAVPAEIGVQNSEGKEPVAPIFQAKAEEVAQLAGMVEGSAVIDARQPQEQKHRNAGRFPAQMKSSAGSAGNECSNDKKDRDQISKAREEEHWLNPCLVCEISFHHTAEGRAIASADSTALPVKVQERIRMRGQSAAGGSCLKWNGEPS
jgi:hypothetical protein